MAKGIDIKADVALMSYVVYNFLVVYSGNVEGVEWSTDFYNNKRYLSSSVSEIVDILKSNTTEYIKTQMTLYGEMYCIYKHVAQCNTEFTKTIYSKIQHLEPEILTPTNATDIYGLYNSFIEFVIQGVAVHIQNCIQHSQLDTRLDAFKTIREKYDSMESTAVTDGNIVQLFKNKSGGENA